MTGELGQQGSSGGPPAPNPEPARRGRALDRTIGIALGILLGAGIVTAFVFLGSEGTIDAPRIDHGGAAGAGHQRGVHGGPAKVKNGGGKPTRAPVVEVVGGAPPESGPPRLDFRRGRRVRLRIRTDSPVGIEIPGLAISEPVESESLLSFRATRTGQFPVIVSVSHIAVATLRIRR